MIGHLLHLRSQWRLLVGGRGPVRRAGRRGAAAAVAAPRPRTPGPAPSSPRHTTSRTRDVAARSGRVGCRRVIPVDARRPLGPDPGRQERAQPGGAAPAVHAGFPTSTRGSHRVRTALVRTRPAVRRPRPGIRAHLGGKLKVVPGRPLLGRRDLSLAYTPGVAEVSRAIAADPSLVDVYTGRGTRSPSSPTARRCSGSATSGRGRRCRSWRERRCCSSTSRASTPSRSASPPPTRTSWSTPSPGSRRRSAGSTWRTSPPALLRGGAPAAGAARPARLARRPARHRRRTLAALVNGARVVGKGLAGRGGHRRGRRGRCRHRRDPAPGGVRDVVVCDWRGVVEPAGADLPAQAPAAATRTRAGCGGRWPGRWPAPTSSSASPAARWRGGVASMAPRSIVFALANPDPEVDPVVAGGTPPSWDGAQRLPEPDQQRAGLPGHLPGRARRRRQAGDRGDEAGRRRGDRGVRATPTAGEIVPWVFDERVVPAVARAVAAAARGDGVARASPSCGVPPSVRVRSSTCSPSRTWAWSTSRLAVVPSMTIVMTPLPNHGPFSTSQSSGTFATFAARAIPCSNHFTGRVFISRLANWMCNSSGFRNGDIVNWWIAVRDGSTPRHHARCRSSAHHRR